MRPLFHIEPRGISAARKNYMTIHIMSIDAKGVGDPKNTGRYRRVELSFTNRKQCHFMRLEGLAMHITEVVKNLLFTTYYVHFAMLLKGLTEGRRAATRRSTFEAIKRGY